MARNLLKFKLNLTFMHENCKSSKKKGSHLFYGSQQSADFYLWNFASKVSNIRWSYDWVYWFRILRARANSMNLIQERGEKPPVNMNNTSLRHLAVRSIDLYTNRLDSHLTSYRRKRCIANCLSDVSNEHFTLDLCTLWASGRYEYGRICLFYIDQCRSYSSGTEFLMKREELNSASARTVSLWYWLLIQIFLVFWLLVNYIY